MVVRISDKTQNYSKVTKLLVKPKLLRFDSLCMAVGTPLFYHISILMGGYQLFDNIKLYALWIVILISIGAVYCIGKKYE